MPDYTNQIRKNKNRGYQQLRVWNDAIDFYKRTSTVFKKFPYELKRIASQAIASADSVHRNIAEGYCRRSIREYIQFLYIALGSLGESVSGFQACRQAEQISYWEFCQLLDKKCRASRAGYDGWLRYAKQYKWIKDE
ncbi:MAG: four helix bundle protein [Candidatus Marinimicrobia bacterium]|nr:four helix bundle protein [Candidatus Neomarinimicrobiota bacterium]